MSKVADRRRASNAVIRANVPVAGKLPNPCEQPAARHLLARAHRTAVKRGDRTTKKTAITKPELEALVATCDGSLEGLRDRSLL